MKKASWILLAVLGVVITVLSVISAVHAYRTNDDYGIGGVRVSKVAGGDAGVETALRAIRGTSAVVTVSPHEPLRIVYALPVPSRTMLHQRVSSASLLSHAVRASRM